MQKNILDSFNIDDFFQIFVASQASLKRLVHLFRITIMPKIIDK